MQADIEAAESRIEDLQTLVEDALDVTAKNTEAKVNWCNVAAYKLEIKYQYELLEVYNALKAENFPAEAK